MDDWTFWLRFWKWPVILILGLVALIVAADGYHNHLRYDAVAALIRAGHSPMEANCVAGGVELARPSSATSWRGGGDGH